MAALEPAAFPGRLNRVLTHPVVCVAFPLAIAAIAAAVLHELAARVSWADVKADVAAASWNQILMATGFTALSFLGLAGYDVVSVRASARVFEAALIAGLGVGPLPSPMPPRSGCCRQRTRR